MMIGQNRHLGALNAEPVRYETDEGRLMKLPVSPDDGALGRAMIQHPDARPLVGTRTRPAR